MKLVKRFWRHVDKKESDDCWEWLACCNDGGHGRFQLYGHLQLAHRVSWAIANKTWPIPEGRYICHTCDNPTCVNPAHLYLGNNTTNMQDRSPLTPDDVKEIRQLRKIGYTYKEIAFIYGVEHHTIGGICRNKHWKKEVIL